MQDTVNASASHAEQMEKLTSEWKELQKGNARRKAAIQVATNASINSEEDIGSALELQTKRIQALREQQKSLEVRLCVCLPPKHYGDVILYF